MRRESIITVPVSSKTAAEIEHFGLAGPAVGEGGAVLLAPTAELEVVGPLRSEVVRGLAKFRAAGWKVRGMSEMTAKEVCRLTGLDGDQALRAMDRLASEPFVFEQPPPGGLARVDRAVCGLGLAVTRGGRFWHLAGRGIDKGSAVNTVLGRLDPDRRALVGAVGDAWNDLPMLDRADLGVLLGRAVADLDVPTAVERIPLAGPAGFLEAAEMFRERCRAAG